MKLALHHPTELRLNEGIVDTTNMMRSILQIACIVLLVLFCFPPCTTGQAPKKPSVLENISHLPYYVSCSRFPGQPPPSNELRSLFDRQARWDDAALRDENRTGSRLRFVKIDERAMPGGRVATRYRVFAEGAPQDRVFSFQTWKVDDTFSDDPRDIYVNTQGLVMTRKPTPEEETSLRAGDAELHVEIATEEAEPMRYALIRRDGGGMIFGSVVARPMVSYDQGCTIEAKLAQPGAAAVLVDVDGFPAKAKISLVLKSEGADVSEKLETDQDGHAVMGVVTTVPGKAQGTLKATAEGRNCLPSVVLPWVAAAPPAVKAP